MKRNCNLELRLVTPSVFYSDNSNYDNDQYTPYMKRKVEDDHMLKESPNEKQSQQLTIFYNGRVAVSDVTEHQARAIILLASREMEEKRSPSPRSDPPSPSLMNTPIYSPTSGLSMKRSLQSFLQKRKTRVQATSPYPLLNHKHHHPNA